MAFHPMKRHAMGLFRLQESASKIGVFTGSFFAFSNLGLEPSFNPMLVEGVLPVLSRDDVNL